MKVILFFVLKKCPQKTTFSFWLDHNQIQVVVRKKQLSAFWLDHNQIQVVSILFKLSDPGRDRLNEL
jgi:hypothetical protein